MCVCEPEGVAASASLSMCHGASCDSPRVQGRGLHRHRLQPDVLLPINSVQPVRHTLGLKPEQNTHSQETEVVVSLLPERIVCVLHGVKPAGCSTLDVGDLIVEHLHGGHKHDDFPHIDHV